MNRLKLALPLLLLLLVSNFSGAVIVPSGVGNYINITISSSSNSFQFMLPFNALKYQSYEAGNLMNIEFFNPSNGVLVKSWLEGNLSNTIQTANLNQATNVIFWLSIANSATTNVIALGFGGTSNTFLDGNNVGESPVLSGAYAQYDNGANVFTYYTNFLGTSAPSGWACSTGSGAPTYSNGITVPNHVSDYCGYTGSAFDPTNVVFDTLWALNQNQPTQRYLNNIPVPTIGYVLLGNDGDGSVNNAWAVYGGGGASAGVNLGVGFSTQEYYASIWQTGSAGFASLQYTHTSSSTSGFTPTTSAFFALGNNQVALANQFFQLARIRNMPLNNVMPSATLSNVITVPTTSTPPIITLQPNPLNFGYTDLITVQATSPIGDTIYIWANSPIIGNPNTLLASTSNSYSYVFYMNYAPPAIGNYVITANDPATGLANSLILQVLPPSNTSSGGTSINLFLPFDTMIEDIGVIVAAFCFFYMYINDKNSNFKYLWLVLGLGFVSYSFITNVGVLSAVTSGNTVSFTYGQIPTTSNGSLLQTAFLYGMFAILCFFLYIFWLNFWAFCKDHFRWK